MKYKTGEEFLNKLYSNMHMEDIVMHTAKPSDTPVEKISNYMDRLESVHTKAIQSNHRMNLLKKIYYDKYVIKELPDNYFILQQRIDRERGEGSKEINKDDLLKRIQNDQKKSLDSWIEYLSSDDANYPMWFKTYAFTGMLKLGQYDKEKETFGKRTSQTTERYLELNQEILAQIYDTLSNEIGRSEVTEEQEEALKNGESFAKLYTYYLSKQSNKIYQDETDGIWIKYEKGSDSKILCDSLQGKNTGWCTAGYQTAKNQLREGDFYVYYTKSVDGKYTQPRIAIRMEDDYIAEIRGIGKNQNLESNMLEITDKKLSEFLDKEKYKRKVSDMNYLTKIDKKFQNNIELDLEELKFLYEISKKIEGFGYYKDPRVNEIKESRNKFADYAKIFDFDLSKTMIVNSIEELKNNSKEEYIIFDGSLDSNENIDSECIKKIKIVTGNITNKVGKENLEKFNNLVYVAGNADFSLLEDAINLRNLQFIGGSASFKLLKDSKGLEKLQFIGGHVDFSSLEKADGLKNLESIAGNADFKSLLSARGLEKLQIIGGSGFFGKLKNADGLENLKFIEELAYFDSLEDARGLRSLKLIGWSCSFKKLKKSQGLGNLEFIGGSTDFSSLEDASDLVSLIKIGNSVDFGLLKTSKGLENLRTIGGTSRFDSLEDARGLCELQTIDGVAYFSSLENPEGLEKLSHIKMDADFQSLKTVKGLENLKNIELYVNHDLINNNTQGYGSK